MMMKLAQETFTMLAAGALATAVLNSVSKVVGACSLKWGSMIVILASKSAILLSFGVKTGERTILQGTRKTTNGESKAKKGKSNRSQDQTRPHRCNTVVGLKYRLRTHTLVNRENCLKQMVLFHKGKLFCLQLSFRRHFPL